MRNSLIILSGGMDSTTILYKYWESIHSAISFNYGSKHNQKEIGFARYHCAKMGVQHDVIDLEFFNEFFSSDLLQSGGQIPEGHYEDESMKQTVVPFRNGIMLSIAAGIAESRGLNSIYIGNHAGDHAIYPDCRPDFISAMNDATKYGTYNCVEILSPFLNLNKRNIALIGFGLGINYSDTWTCYKGEEVHCGKCGSCTERKEALEGFDNTIYEK